MSIPFISFNEGSAEFVLHDEAVKMPHAFLFAWPGAGNRVYRGPDHDALACF